MWGVAVRLDDLTISGHDNFTSFTQHVPALIPTDAPAACVLQVWRTQLRAVPPEHILAWKQQGPLLAVWVWIRNCKNWRYKQGLLHMYSRVRQLH
jgi:hypothetical protein